MLLRSWFRARALSCAKTSKASLSTLRLPAVPHLRLAPPTAVERCLLIGDIHGCDEEFEELLQVLKYDESSGKDLLILVGDLVGKGPYSDRVLQRASRAGAVSVRGNHDHYALADPKNKLGLSSSSLSYLGECPLSITVPSLNLLVVHAGLLPDTLPESEANTPMNLMTMRNLTKSEEDNQWKARSDVKQGEAWASQWKGPQHVVFGHDAVRGLQEYPLATGLDTGCVYGGKLTALVLPERRIVQVPSRQPNRHSND